MDQFKYSLGTTACDSVTGFEGIITARYEFLNGCIRYMLEALKDGDVKENVFDEDRLVLAGATVGPDLLDVAKPRTGGARTTPPRTGAR